MAPNREQRSGSGEQPPLNAADELTVALQELRALRPLLRDAADYAEAAYLCSDRKDLEICNVRDYAVSMLVSLVDRLGNVAHKVASEAARQATQVDAAEVHVASLHQRLQACWEYSGRDGLNRQQQAKAVPRLPKTYAAPDAVADAGEGEEVLPYIIRESFDFGPSSPTELSETESSPTRSPQLLLPRNESSKHSERISTISGGGRMLPLSLSESIQSRVENYSHESSLCFPLGSQYVPAVASPPSTNSSLGRSPSPENLLEHHSRWSASRSRPTKYRIADSQHSVIAEEGPRLTASHDFPKEDEWTPGDSPGLRKKSLLGGIFGRRRARSVPITRENTVNLYNRDSHL